MGGISRSASRQSNEKVHSPTPSSTSSLNTPSVSRRSSLLKFFKRKSSASKAERGPILHSATTPNSPALSPNPLELAFSSFQTGSESQLHAAGPMASRDRAFPTPPLLQAGDTRFQTPRIVAVPSQGDGSEHAARSTRHMPDREKLCIITDDAPEGLPRARPKKPTDTKRPNSATYLHEQHWDPSRQNVQATNAMHTALPTQALMTGHPPVGETMGSGAPPPRTLLLWHCITTWMANW